MQFKKFDHFIKNGALDHRNGSEKKILIGSENWSTEIIFLCPTPIFLFDKKLEHRKKFLIKKKTTTRSSNE